jgi:leader peptidase (prepilin peptidase)/N-methyltransferase
MAAMLVYYSLFFVFIIGLVIGSFLNVAVARLPLEKSLIWPGSRCGACYQPIRWHDNLPLVSYLWLRGRCRSCGVGFSIRYFLVELLTGAGFAALFYLEVVVDIHGWNTPALPWGWRPFGFPWQSWAGFAAHAVLFSLLLAASVTDLNGREIPLPLTLTGTVLGVIFGVLMPWPWPLPPPAVPAAPLPGMAVMIPWFAPGPEFPQGVQTWPVWWPLSAWLGPGGNWQTGLATSVAGALVGTFMMRAIGFLFSAGLGREALGMGDADLMMMVGAFLGWQVAAVSLFVSVIPACFFGVIQLVLHRDNSLPFGPSLAAGSMLTCLGWAWLPPSLGMFLFSWPLLAAAVLIAAVFLFVSSLLIRTTRA